MSPGNDGGTTARQGLELRDSTTTSRDVPRRGLAFRPAAPRGAREASLRRPAGRGGGDAMRDAQADVPSAGWLRAQLAFKDSMVRGILQFTPSIAFRYVLHRCESRDIRCRESFWLRQTPRRSPPALRARGRSGGRAIAFEFSLALSAPGLVCSSARRAHGGATGKEGRGSGLASPSPAPGSHTSSRSSAVQDSTMILPQVHLRKPCYDFSFL